MLAGLLETVGGKLKLVLATPLLSFHKVARNLAFMTRVFSSHTHTQNKGSALNRLLLDECPSIVKFVFV